MGDSDLGKQDQRTVSNTEDNDAVTIEFLRARLLSERSVSKSARQRADELTKMVAELEEQLRVVSLQRMKAEKATADILAILESNVISDVSDMCDSNFDQDTPCERHSVNLKVRKNVSEEVLDSNDGFSPDPGRSMSGKVQKDCSSSAGKYKDQSMKRRNSFTSTYSSPKHRTGKSCRQIKRKEPRSFSLEHETNSIKVGTPENGVSPTENGSDVGPDILGGFDETRNDKMSPHAQLSGYWRNEQNSSGNDLGYNADERDGDRDMEKALEHQAELIGRYEEMERDQSEWEEKFRENNNSTPDFCDPGNRSDVTEERYEVKVQNARSAETIPLQNHVEKSKVQELSDVRADGFLPPTNVDTGFFREISCISTHASEIASQDFAFPTARVRQNQPVLGNSHDTGPVHSQNHSNSLGSHDPPRTTYIPSFASNPGSSLSKGNASEVQKDSHALVPHRAPNGVGGVLEALRKARQSLQQKINGFGSDGKRNELAVPLTMPGGKEDAAVDCVAFFRLPTESSVEANGPREFLNPSSRLSLENCFPDTRDPAAASNPLLTGFPYLGTRSAISFEDQLLTSKYVEGGSRISAQKSHFDSGLTPALPSFNKYVYPTFPISASYPALTPQTTSLRSLSTPLQGTNAGVGPPVDLSPDNQNPPIFMEHNPEETPGPESQAPIVYPSGYRQDDTSDIVMASSSTSTSPSLGIYDDMSIMGSGFYPQRYGGDHVHYQRNRSEEGGKSVDPRLMMLLEFFRQLFIRKRELLNRMFPGLQDECGEVFKKVGNMLCLKKPSHQVVTLRRSLSIGSGDLSSSLRLDRFNVRTVIPGGGTDKQGGGDDERPGDKISGGSKSK